LQPVGGAYGQTLAQALDQFGLGSQAAAISLERPLLRHE
jgi:hypothetical protein